MWQLIKQINQRIKYILFILFHSDSVILTGDMPILRSDDNVVEDDPKMAAEHVLERVKVRPIPFHWFRNILKTPTWYMNVTEEIKNTNPDVELLDVPTFFELYRI